MMVASTADHLGAGVGIWRTECPCGRSLGDMERSSFHLDALELPPQPSAAAHSASRRRDWTWFYAARGLPLSSPAALTLHVVSAIMVSSRRICSAMVYRMRFGALMPGTLHTHGREDACGAVCMKGAPAGLSMRSEVLMIRTLSQRTPA